MFPRRTLNVTDTKQPFSIIIINVMELDHLLTLSSLTYPEVSSKVCHDSFCQLGNSVSLPWVIYYEAFYLHVVSTLVDLQLDAQNSYLFT